MKNNLNPFPPEVKTLGITAPASGYDHAKLRRSMALIRSFGIRIVFTGPEKNHSLLPYLADDDSSRAAAFNALLRDPSVDAIHCVRGGYGSPRLLPLIDWETFRKRNTLPVIGYSDITALHLAMLSQKAGIPVASQMAASFAGSMEDCRTFRGMRRALHLAFRREEKTRLSKLGCRLTPFNGIRREVRGPVIPVNLSLLVSLCGTPFLPDLSGVILVAEDIGEQVRLLDRHLNQLYLSGITDRIGALVFGEFTACQEARIRNRMLRNFAEKLSVPVFSGLAYGHELPSESFVWGETGSLAPSGDFSV